jgi:hypothetical protein
MSGDDGGSAFEGCRDRSTNAVDHGLGRGSEAQPVEKRDPFRDWGPKQAALRMAPDDYKIIRRDIKWEMCEGHLQKM